jgi:hypothetical protein
MEKSTQLKNAKDAFTNRDDLVLSSQGVLAQALVLQPSETFQT